MVDHQAAGAGTSEARPIIRLENVTKQFGDTVAVDGVSLEIMEGELFALLGASGCGKSTLLRMLAGFEMPTSGEIYIDGVSMKGVAPYDRPINMMFQSYALFPHMSVEQNIAYGLKQDGLSKDAIKARVSEMLKLVELEKYARRKPSQLSGGQRQRVALARSLAKQPKVLLLDEPLGALDRKLRQRTQLELVDIQERVGTTFVMVTHDQEEAMTMSTRLSIMRDGKISQIGAPTEVYEYPKSRFVADFIGNVNLFEGEITEDEPDHARIRSPEFANELYISHGVSGHVGTKVWVAVRPEKVKVEKVKPDVDYNWDQGVVEDIVYTGNLSTYHVRLSTGKLVQAEMTNQTRLHELPITWGDEVYVSWLRRSGVVLLS